MFQKIKERHGMEECFLAREVHHDVSFIRQYLTQEDCEDLNLFSYGLIKNDYIINEVSDDDGWKKIKNSLISNIGSNTIPIIYVESIEEGNVLTLHHEHDGRDLELEYAERVVDHLTTLWGDVVKLITIIEDEPFEI